MSYAIYDATTLEFYFCSDFSTCYDWVEKNGGVVEGRAGRSGQIWYVSGIKNKRVFF